jgi:serine/threonine-protein kinase
VLTADSPTMLSVSGMILGTAGYMGPDQARGQEADKRADIWAFGVAGLHRMSQLAGSIRDALPER